MKDKDKMKSFFVQRLGDDTPGDDGWNMPSDDIFNSAKVHFPKQKKKKRPFLFWMSAGMIGAIVLGLGVYSFLGGVAVPQGNKTAVKHEVEISNNTIVTKNIKEETSELSAEEMVLAESKVVTEDRPVATATTKPSVNNKKSIAKKSLTSKDEYKESKEIVTQKSFPVTNNNLISKTQTTTEKPNVNLAILNSATTTTNNTLPNARKENRFNSILPKLVNQKVNEVISESEKPDDLNIDVVTNDKFEARKIQKWEVGLTYAGFMLPFNHLTFKDEGGTQEISFDVKNANINLPVTRRLNRRWSITSGYSYADVDFDVRLKEQFIYNQNATEDNFETLIDEIINDGVVSGSIEFNDQKRSIDLEFVDNLELMDGDVLDFNALIPLRLKLHQIPLLVNCHFGKRKLEWLLHAGTALEYFEVEIPFFNMTAYEGNNLLTHSIDFEPIYEKKMSYAIMAGGGVKYHINNHFNIGLNTKIDLSALPFARYELGLFYGFTTKKKNSMMQF